MLPCPIRPALPTFHPPKMLQDGRMAGLVKLHRSAQPRGERQVRAVHEGGA